MYCIVIKSLYNVWMTRVSGLKVIECKVLEWSGKVREHFLFLQKIRELLF